MPTAVPGLQVCGLSLPAQEPTPASMRPSQGPGVDCAMDLRTIEVIGNRMQLKPYLATQDELKSEHEAAHLNAITALDLR